MSGGHDHDGEAAFTREALIEAIRLGEGRFTKRELARSLNIKGEDRIALKAALKTLEDEGVAVRTKDKAYALRGALPPVTVLEIVDRDVDGEMLCRPAKRELDGPVIRLAPGDAAGGKGDSAAGIGDKVLARLTQEDDGSYTARVIKKLGGSAHRILCVYRESGRGGARLVPVDRRSKHELLPAKGGDMTPVDGDLVMVRLASERRHGLKTALIEEVIGSADSPRAGSVIALAEHAIPQGFSDAETKEAKTVKPASQGNREDLTGIPLITIDPADARDHDDAIHAAPDDDPKNAGGWVVHVAIADVAAYVTPGSALDRGARKRGVSVYLPDRVVPMLPERLSNDLCSLREGEARPCLAVRMVFDPNGNKRAHRFIRGWMRSAAGLSYEDAQAAIDGHGAGKAETLKRDVLEPLWGAYRALKAARDRREPLEIDSPERKIRIGEDGSVIGVEARERFDAHKLVEEMMIQANVAAAEALEEKKTPLIYRVHDEPGAEKIDSLSGFLPTVGLKWHKAERPYPARFNRVLEAAKGGEHYETVNEVVLRSQSQAIYDVNNLGHFGLNLAKYAHFTSPIRRYADLTVHRALIRAYGLGEDGQTSEERSELEAIAEETTVNERRAMAAERDATDRFIAAFLADRIGTEFAGRITGVTRFGAFVRLAETGADGICPMSGLGDDFFIHDETAHALIGQNTGGTYRLGMAVQVKLLEAAPVTGGLVLEIVTPPEKGEPPRGRRKGGRGRPGDHRRGGPGGAPRGGSKGAKKKPKARR